MEATSPILETGKWWTDRWWENSEYLDQVPYTLATIDAAVDNLVSIFDSNWALNLIKNPSKNLVFPYLFLIRGTQPLEFLVYLGTIVDQLKTCKGFQKKINDLRGAKGASALLELEIAFCLIRDRFSIEFPKEGKTRSPDILASSGTTEVFIECKRLEDEQWEKLEKQLMQEVIDSLRGHVDPATTDVQIRLNNRLTDVFMGYKYEHLNDSIVSGISSVVEQHVERTIGRFHGQATINMAGLGEITLKRRDGDPDTWITGMERSTPAKLRRILTNGVLRACKQLPKGTPGIAVVFSNYLPEKFLTGCILNSITEMHQDQYRDLAGVLLLPQQFITSGEQDKLLWVNRNTSDNPGLHKVFESLRKGFGAQMI